MIIIIRYNSILCIIQNVQVLEKVKFYSLFSRVMSCRRLGLVLKQKKQFQLKFNILNKVKFYIIIPYITHKQGELGVQFSVCDFCEIVLTNRK